MCEKFNSELIQKYEPIINKLISKIKWADACGLAMGKDDLRSYFLEHLWIATKEYDDKRNASLDTFIYCKLRSRFLDLVNKVKIRGNRVIPMSMIDKSEFALYAGADEMSSNKDRNYIADQNIDYYRGRDLAMDMKFQLNSLSSEHQLIFEECFILNKSIREVCESNNFSFSFVQRIRKDIFQFVDELKLLVE